MDKDTEWEANDIFSTEVNEKIIQEARSRIISRLSGMVTTLSFSNIDKSLKTSILTDKIKTTTWYLTDTVDQLKQQILERADSYYEKSLREYENGECERAIVTLNKAFSYNSLNIQFYLLRYEMFIQLCDFKSAIVTINKLLSILSIYVEESDSTYDSLKRDLIEKTTFCYYMSGQTYFDTGLFLDALDAFNKASELKPNSLLFKVKR
jgi:tetratricopeptide (TPR) repeat protein